MDNKRLKAEELMINDFVRVYGYNNDSTSELHWYYRKITSDWLENMERCARTNEYITNHGIDLPYPQLGDTEPIHLTEEILKANAFEVCYESCYQTKFNIWSFDEKICVEYKISKQTEDYNYLKIFIDGDERVSIPIRYVHELQHAIRLCGLNELADNFKVD